MAIPRTIEIRVNGRQKFVTTFDEPLLECQRVYFEQEEHRLMRFARWGIETRDGDLSWQMAVLCVLIGAGSMLVDQLRALLSMVLP